MFQEPTSAPGSQATFLTAAIEDGNDRSVMNGNQCTNARRIKPVRYALMKMLMYLNNLCPTIVM